MRTALVFGLSFCVALVFCQNADSLAVAAQVDSLIKISRDLTEKKDFEKALEVNAAAEKIALDRFGRESAAYGNCLFNQGRVMYLKGDFPAAEKWYLEAKSIREKAVGKEHPLYATSLNNLAALYMNMGQYEKAEPLYLETIAVREKTLGKEHRNYAQSLYSLARLYQDMGQYEKAEPLYLEAKTIQEKILGKEHSDYTQSLSSLAILYSVMGQYEKAEPLYLEAKAIREKTLGKEHPEYASILNNMAIMYWDMGQYEKAEPLYLEAKAIREKALGKEHPEYAKSLSGLANLYANMGQYEKAEPLYQEAIAIQGKALGKEKSNYALSLNNLAVLYVVMGQYEKAEPLYLEAKAIREKALGKEHPEYAMSLNNLANLCVNMGQYEKAEPLYQEAKAIREKALGKEHPLYAQSLNNLAVLYVSMGQYEKAESLHLEAKAIREKALGKEHPEYTQSLNNLALLYPDMGQYEKAEPLFLEAKAIREKVLGKEHSDYANNLINLANLYANMGQYEKAEPLYLELSAVNQLLVANATHHLSEKELNNYLNKFSKNQNQILSFAQKSRSKKTATACYDNTLFYKGFLLNAVNRVKHLALSDSTSTEKYNLLKSCERRLATEFSKPIAERDSTSIADLEARANNLEKDLARTVAGFGEAQRQVKWQEVQQNLKADEAAVEFVHYRYQEKKQTDSTMYAALVLRPGAKQPEFIPLFEEKQLVQLLAQNQKGQNFAAVYASRGATPLKTAGELHGLYDLIWRPLKKHLKGIKTVFYAPSGLLHRINFDAIPLENKQTLSDHFRLVRLSSSRSLVVPDLTKTDTANAAILFGGIQYKIDTTAVRQDSIPPEVLPAVNSPELSFSYADRSVPSRGENWGYLPGTATEVSEIQGLFQKSNVASQVFFGKKADEESFKSLGKNKPSPRVLHLATHGFFFPDPKSTSARFQTSPTFADAEPVFKMSDHPMIRSGLILAGGNHAWATGKPLRPGMEDGILTAYEISQMNLSNTELVVLSACETGLGDISGNEGVYGLQRAFKIAGAKYLIMSLWQVPDQETSVFMTNFYKHWLEGKMSIPDAFRTTQREMRERFLKPYLWAGFVLVE